MLHKAQWRKILGFTIIVTGLCVMYWFAYSTQYQPYSLFKVVQQSPYDPAIPQPPKTPASNQIFEKNYLVVMSWNVENLFDTQDDPKKYDEEFTPNGTMHWTDEVLRHKLYNLTDVVRRIDDGYGPDILGLCEVENSDVLSLFAKQSNIESLGYRYSYINNGNDPRGIDVALLSRYPAEVTWHKAMPGNREILKAKFNLHGHALYILLNHWRSRLGGKETSQPQRIDAAKLVAKLVQEILQHDQSADIIVMGDFNDNPNDVSITKHLGAIHYNGHTNKSDLYNLTYTTTPSHWVKPRSHFDQMIISRGLLDQQGFTYIQKSFKIVGFPYMCNQAGQSLSFSVQNKLGYSDHFPVLVYLQMPK